MPDGKIKKVVLEKGYGFIEPDGGGDDVFFHHSSTGDVRIEDLNRGDAVTYDVEPGRDGKGPRAINVARLA